MQIRCYVNTKQPHHCLHAEALQAGMRRHGHAASINQLEDYQPSDLAVMWGHRRETIMRSQRASGLDYLVMERGYIGDRMHWTSLGFNGLNGCAEFIGNSDDSRGRQFHTLLQPWVDEREAEYYLICGQVLGDASLAHVDYPAWVQSLPKEWNGLPVLFRPHPLGAHHFVTDKPKSRGSLEESLRKAKAVWTFNSNSAVDALINGVPAVTADPGSMVYSQTATSIDEALIYPDRTRLLNQLAWCQWTLEELRDGTAWDHVKQRYE